MSTYKFPESFEAGSRTILTTSGILGNVLEVKSDGTTRYHRSENRRHIRRGRECNGDVLENGEERRSDEEGDANSEARIHYKHERYCETLKFPARSQYRIFAMNRDLTACEYLHRSVRREQEVAAVFGDEMSMSMIQYPISRRPELRRLITFVPVKPELGSKEISCQYRVRQSTTLRSFVITGRQDFFFFCGLGKKSSLSNFIYVPNPNLQEEVLYYVKFMTKMWLKRVFYYFLIFVANESDVREI